MLAYLVHDVREYCREVQGSFRSVSSAGFPLRFRGIATPASYVDVTISHTLALLPADGLSL